VAEPLYKQIAEDLRDQIESGRLDAGHQLPTEAELREQYNASRNTIRDALRWLTTRGLVDARAGQGTFVAQRIVPFVIMLSEWEAVCQGGLEYYNRQSILVNAPRVEVLKPTDEIARMLKLTINDEIVSRQQARYIDNIPWSLQTSFYPRDLVTRGAEQLLRSDDISMGAVAYLHQTLGLEQVGYDDRIQVGPPNKDEAALFRLADDGRVSVITAVRTGYTTSDRGPVPFRVTITAFPADRNQLLIRSGQVPGLDPPDITES
jgi:GntR family transcriptional regulator